MGWHMCSSKQTSWCGELSSILKPPIMQFFSHGMFVYVLEVDKHLTTTYTYIPISIVASIQVNIPKNASTRFTSKRYTFIAETCYLDIVNVIAQFKLAILVS